MLRTSGPTSSPDIQRAIDGILKEDADFDRNENRSAMRDHLVRSVKIEFRDVGKILDSFSRNVSTSGIGLITHYPIPEKTIATLKIARLHAEELLILSECRWCKPYGVHWYFTGWQYINLKHETGR